MGDGRVRMRQELAERIKCEHGQHHHAKGNTRTIQHRLSNNVSGRYHVSVNCKFVVRLNGNGSNKNYNNQYNEKMEKSLLFTDAA